MATIGTPTRRRGRPRWINLVLQRAVAAATVATGTLAGCSPAPSQDILGSYFPSWMVCALAGIGATVVVRQILVVSGLDKTLPAPLLVYLAFAVAFSFGAWLIWLD